MKYVMNVVASIIHIFIVGTFVSGKNLALSIEEKKDN